MRMITLDYINRYCWIELKRGNGGMTVVGVVTPQVGDKIIDFKQNHLQKCPLPDGLVIVKGSDPATIPMFSRASNPTIQIGYTNETNKSNSTHNKYF